jgi:hypothetical protein
MLPHVADEQARGTADHAMRYRLITGALLTCLAGFAIGAGVYSADWLSCMGNDGGEACREARDMAAGAWAGLATNALALATNVLNEDDR